MRSRSMLFIFALLLLTGALVDASPGTSAQARQAEPALMSPSIHPEVLPSTKENFANLAVAECGSTGGTCRYACGSTFHYGTSTDCCSARFQCPDGQWRTPFGYNNGSGWQICGWPC
jgi:hypothetical protein